MEPFGGDWKNGEDELMSESQNGFGGLPYYPSSWDPAQLDFAPGRDFQTEIEELVQELGSDVYGSGAPLCEAGERQDSKRIIGSW